VKLVKRRFDCSARAHREAVTKLTKSTHHRFSASISHLHPLFNEWDIPKTAVKTAEFFMFNQQAMSEEFFMDLISQCLVTPNVRHIESTINNRYNNMLNARLELIRTMQESGCTLPDGEAAPDPKDIDAFKLFTQRGMTRKTIIDIVCLYRIMQLPPIEEATKSGTSHSRSPGHSPRHDTDDTITLLHYYTITLFHYYTIT